MQCEAEPMRHEPCGLLRNTDAASNLAAAHTVLAVHQQPQRGKPLIQTKRGILKNGPSLGGELALRMPSRALPSPLRLKEAN